MVAIRLRGLQRLPGAAEIAPAPAAVGRDFGWSEGLGRPFLEKQRW